MTWMFDFVGRFHIKKKKNHNTQHYFINIPVWPNWRLLRRKEEIKVKTCRLYLEDEKGGKNTSEENLVMKIHF